MNNYLATVEPQSLVMSFLIQTLNAPEDCYLMNTNMLFERPIYGSSHWTLDHHLKIQGEV